jgi:hypothetical protein
VSPNKPCGILRNVVNPRQPLRNSATQAQFAFKKFDEFRAAGAGYFQPSGNFYSTKIVAFGWQCDC